MYQLKLYLPVGEYSRAHASLQDDERMAESSQPANQRFLFFFLTAFISTVDSGPERRENTAGPTGTACQAVLHSSCYFLVGCGHMCEIEHCHFSARFTRS